MRIVTICGSVTKTPKQYWDDYAQKLTLEGCCVFMVNVWGLREWLHGEGKKTKELLDRVHFEKIFMSTEVHVLRMDGYVGQSTRNEINYALSREIPVKYVDFSSIESKEVRRSE